MDRHPEYDIWLKHLRKLERHMRKQGRRAVIEVEDGTRCVYWEVQKEGKEEGGKGPLRCAIGGMVKVEEARHLQRTYPNIPVAVNTVLLRDVCRMLDLNPTPRNQKILSQIQRLHDTYNDDDYNDDDNDDDWFDVEGFLRNVSSFVTTQGIDYEPST